MKKSKVLVPALAMLCLSTAATVTGTVAWFAANTVVSATTMNVKAKSDATNLQISLDGQTNWGTSVTRASTNKELFPVEHDEFTAKADITNTSKWYFRYSSSESSSTQGQTDAMHLPANATNWGDYVGSEVFYFRLKNNTSNIGANLRVKNCTLPKASTSTPESVVYKGISAIVVGANGYQEFTADFAANESAETPTIGTTLLNAVDYVADDATSTYSLTVYYYVKGGASEVYTNNIASLTGSVNFDFTITPTARP